MRVDHFRILEGQYIARENKYEGTEMYDLFTEIALTLYLPVTKIAEFANSVDLDEVAHNEPPHLDRHCLPSSL